MSVQVNFMTRDNTPGSAVRAIRDVGYPHCLGNLSTEHATRRT